MQLLSHHVFHRAVPALLFSVGAGTGLAAHAAGEHGPGHGGGHHGSATTIGEPGNPARASRTVHVEMTDTMRFSPAVIDVKQGETIRFVVRNTGRLRHEWVLGTASELKAHNEQMKKSPGMQHSEPNMISLDAGQSGEVVWRFTKAGRVDIGCLQPGHYDAGMKGTVSVLRP